MSQPTLLVTAYRPFQGRTVNGSATVLQWLRRHKHRWPHLHVRTLLLPVAWKGAMQRLRAAQQRLPQGGALFLLGMGEGHPGRVAWELRAVNAAHGNDELGLPGPGSIAPGGPAELHSDWKPSFSDDLSPHAIVYSQNAGEYLCNRLLWENLNFIKQRLGGAAFLHLPPQGKELSKTYLKCLTSVLDHAFISLKSKPEILRKS